MLRNISQVILLASTILSAGSAFAAIEEGTSVQDRYKYLGSWEGRKHYFLSDDGSTFLSDRKLWIDQRDLVRASVGERNTQNGKLERFSAHFALRGYESSEFIDSTGMSRNQDVLRRKRTDGDYYSIFNEKRSGSMSYWERTDPGANYPGISVNNQVTNPRGDLAFPEKNEREKEGFPMREEDGAHIAGHLYLGNWDGRYHYFNPDQETVFLSERGIWIDRQDYDLAQNGGGRSPKFFLHALDRRSSVESHKSHNQVVLSEWSQDAQGIQFKETKKGSISHWTPVRSRHVGVYQESSGQRRDDLEDSEERDSDFGQHENCKADDQHMTGPIVLQGPQGEPGRDGLAGVEGSAGEPGKPGRDGKDGMITQEDRDFFYKQLEENRKSIEQAMTMDKQNDAMNKAGHAIAMALAGIPVMTLSDRPVSAGIGLSQFNMVNAGAIGFNVRVNSRFTVKAGLSTDFDKEYYGMNAGVALNF